MNSWGRLLVPADRNDRPGEFTTIQILSGAILSQEKDLPAIFGNKL
jgi:hypothetical protein